MERKKDQQPRQADRTYIVEVGPDGWELLDRAIAIIERRRRELWGSRARQSNRTEAIHMALYLMALVNCDVVDPLLSMIRNFDNSLDVLERRKKQDEKLFEAEDDA